MLLVACPDSSKTQIQPGQLDFQLDRYSICICMCERVLFHKIIWKPALIFICPKSQDK